MSRYIATSAIRGANNIVMEAEAFLHKALAEKGPDAKIGFPNTAYFLPTILGLTGQKVEKVGDLVETIGRARALLHPVPPDTRWTPYLGEALDSGIATLLAEEAIMALRYLYGEQPEPFPGFRLAQAAAFTSPEFAKEAAGDGHLNGPIDDIQLRSWGIQLVDGRMPGFAAIVGCAKSNEVAVKIVRELQRRNILIFLSGNVNGRSIIHQLQEEGVEMGYDTYIVPFGTDTISAIYALGFATRSALTFGGMKGGQTREIFLYNKYRVFAFVLALGEVDDLKYATAAGAISYGFPVIADTVIPQVLPTGITAYEHVISMPFDEIEGQDDLERAEKLVQKCIEVRGVKIKMTEVPIPVPYGSAFEGEVVRRADLRVEFGGKASRCFEYLYMLPMDKVEDGRITVYGDGFEKVEPGGAMDLGIIVEVAGRKMQEDFEPVLERQIHHFINGASGIQHIGQRDIAWIRVSKSAAEKGLTLKHFGDILHARFHADFGAIVDKVQVSIYTNPADIQSWLQIAREAYNKRNQRLMGMTDEEVNEFYSCTLCLPEGEQISLADGSFIPVEKLVETIVEDKDLSVLTLAGENLEARPVNELFINPAPDKLVRITLTNGNALTLTRNHKVLVDKTEGLDWVPAGRLRPGDYLVAAQQTHLVPAPGEDRYIIDYLPDDYKVGDDAFILNSIKPLLLAQYGGYAQAAHALGIGYERLYSALYEREEFNRQRFTLGEVKKLVAALGLDWNAVKGDVRVFQAGCRLQKTRLDEEVLYAAGLVASDGHVKWRGEEGKSGTWVQFTNTETALVSRFSQIMESLFGVAPEVYSIEPHTAVSGKLVIKGRRPAEVCYVYNTLLGRLMAGLGIGQLDGENKWNGEVISTLPPSLVAAFLRGFFDGDGHVMRGRAAITTRSYREAQHIHLLLKKVGISSYIGRITRGYQVATRSPGDFACFRSVIGSEHPVKRAKMERAAPAFDDQHVVRTDTVPWQAGRLLGTLLERYREQLQVTRLSVDYKTLQAWRRRECRASKEKLRRLLDDLRAVVDPNDRAYQELVAWSRSPVVFERVKAVEKVNSPNGKVYNFAVAETHNYLVNGVVVKNCQSFAPNHVCVISPERVGLCGAYSWLDCKASYQINPTGPNQPIPKGIQLDPIKGYWQGANAFAQQASHGTVETVSMYSLMENPMTACLTEDAEVLVDGRLTRIGEFVNAHREQTFHTSSSLTLGPTGQVQADRVVALHKNPAPAELIRLVTKAGHQLLLTANHKVAVDRPEGMTWMRADTLRKGDRVFALKHLKVTAPVPDLIDLLPDDLRVSDAALVEDMTNGLRAKFGSLAAAYREVGINPIDPRTRSISISDLKRIAAALGDDWASVKRAIHQVAGPMGNWKDALPRLDPDLFYLLGLLASDGSLSRRGKYECFVNFVNTNEGLLNAFAETYARVFPDRSLGRAKKDAKGGTIGRRQIRSTQPAYTLYGANPLLGLIADAFGVKMVSESRWDLGRLIGLPEDRIAAFLAGSFDGDGSVRVRKYAGKWAVGEAYLCIDDRRAASHLQLLLKRLGIVSHIKASGRVYKVTMHGQDLRRFTEVAPVQHPVKRKTLAHLMQRPQTKIEKSQSDVLPYATGKALATLPARQVVLSPSTLYYYRSGRSRPVLSNVEKVLAAEPSTAAALAPFLHTDCFLDTVTCVEKMRNDEQYDYVYNLTLMDIHSYWANQILVANCGCFECIVMVIPEANGVMVLSREDTSMSPAGMTFSTLAGMAGGGLQTPGVMGVGKYFITSKKFIAADGGFKRVVWMSSFLKETMKDELQKAAEYAGVPDLLDKIADERVATSVDQLLPFLEEKGHPALTMPPLM